MDEMEKFYLRVITDSTEKTKTTKKSTGHCSKGSKIIPAMATPQMLAPLLYKQPLFTEEKSTTR